MSDMLQLVGEISYPHAWYYPYRRTLSVANVGDKLKHVEHFLGNSRVPLSASKSAIPTL